MNGYDKRTGCSYSCPFYDRQPDDTHQDVCLADECTGQRIATDQSKATCIPEKGNDQ